MNYISGGLADDLQLFFPGLIGLYNEDSVNSRKGDFTVLREMRKSFWGFPWGQFGGLETRGTENTWLVFPLRTFAEFWGTAESWSGKEGKSPIVAQILKNKVPRDEGGCHKQTFPLQDIYCILKLFGQETKPNMVATGCI